MCARQYFMENPGTRQSHPRFMSSPADQLEMVRPLTAPVIVPPVPEGYQLRLLQAKEQDAYESLFHLAFDDVGRFPEIQSRTLPEGFFVIEYLPSRQFV